MPNHAAIDEAEFHRHESIRGRGRLGARSYGTMRGKIEKAR